MRKKPLFSLNAKVVMRKNKNLHHPMHKRMITAMRRAY